MAAAPLPQTVDEVIAALDAIIAHAHRRGARRGYFAALYRGTTVRVRDHIRAGRFADPARMDRLDACFAGHYLRAERAHAAGQALPRSWAAAFQAEDDDRLLILQHLLLGMNAHINVDLGRAAAETAPGALPALHADYLHLNRILREMVDEVQQALVPCSPWLGLLDRLGGAGDEALASFSITVARDEAWEAAGALDALAGAPERQADLLRELDRKARVLARLIERGGRWVAPLVRWRERDRSGDPASVRRVIDTLVDAFPA